MKWDQDVTGDVNTDEGKSCFICDKIKWSPRLIVGQNNLAVAMLDEYPVTRFHVLVVPKDHVDGYFALTRKQKNAITDLVDQIAVNMMKKDSNITGFNIGWNYGESAGQTVPHAHCHVIPRRDGDIEDPTGGIRGAIPEKRIYK